MNERDVGRKERLADHTTFRIGGVADHFCVPATQEELFRQALEAARSRIQYRVLGRGSNLLVPDSGVRGYVFKLTDCCGELSLEKTGTVRAGAGVSLHRLIGFCISHNLFAYEYLSSVPGTVGGAVAMNAGGGMHEGVCISDHLRSVTFFDGKQVRTMPKDECQFGFRRSRFQAEPTWIILEALFDLPQQDRTIGEEKRRDRLKWSLEHQDIRYPSAGSVFSQGSGRVFGLLRGWRLPRAGWSLKAGNWINNYGNARFRDVMFLIRVGRFLHRCAGKHPVLEIKVWK